MPALEGNDRSDCRNSKGSDESGWDEMRTTIEKLRAEILVRDERMEQMVEDMNRMRVTAKALVGVGEEDRELISQFSNEMEGTLKVLAMFNSSSHENLLDLYGIFQ